MNSIVITGGSGLLALNWAFAKRSSSNVLLGLHNKSASISGVISKNIDLNSKVNFLKCLDEFKPEFVIHTAGLTNIDICEQDPGLAKKVNVDLAVNVCQACKSLGIPMVQISTDNLFSGNESLVDELHPVNPVNIYGATKAEAEARILDIMDDVLILRTNFYGWGPVYKPSFSDMIINELRKENPITLFTDVFYTPILIAELVGATENLLNLDARGIFNVVGDERLSKFEFGIKLAKKFNLNSNLIRAGKLKDRKDLANRPFDMSLSNQKTCKFIGRNIGNVDSHLSNLQQQEESTFYYEVQQV